MQRNNGNYWPTKYWHKLPDGRVQCDLCPKHCTLREGKRGACYIRKHHQGELILTSYGFSSGFCIDPIEKKPLNHFYPGSKVLSFGTAGCNLSCQFCQNWDISRSRQQQTLALSATPEQIVIAAQANQCQSIAFTYNDPVIFLEYAVDVAKVAQQTGIDCVAVTAGYICEEPRVEFFELLSAANVDLKAFSEKFYRKICHGQLQPVLETLLYLGQETDVWFEITTLLIPDENDSDNELHQLCQWIAEHLGTKVPLHFSAFHPDFKMLTKEKTPLATIQRARAIALSYGLNYVYCGNVVDPKADSTYCPECRHILIERNWYELGDYHLTDSGRCRHCGYQLEGRFSDRPQHFGRKRIPVNINQY